LRRLRIQALEWGHVQMSTIRFAAIAAVVGLCALGWQKHQQHADAAELAAITDMRGFITFPTPEGITPKTVLVIAALNCPSDGAQRADWLAQQLAERNISHVRSSHVGFPVPQGDDDAAIEAAVETFNKRSRLIGKGETPFVYVNGKVKSNPDLDEVIAEYNEAQQF
jgi:hypothetical protein